MSTGDQLRERRKNWSWILFPLIALLALLPLFARWWPLDEPTSIGNQGKSPLDRDSVDDSSAATTNGREALVAAELTANVSHIAPAGVQLLSLGSLTPASGSQWLVRAESEGTPHELQVIADANGFILGPAGKWILTSSNQEWVPDHPEVIVRPGETSVVWVHRTGTRGFRVTDPRGTPIENVHVFWDTVTSFMSEVQPKPGQDSPFFSDPSGFVALHDCRCECGIATFLHPNYDRTSLSLCGPQKEIVSVVLHDSIPGSRIELETFDGASVHGASVYSAQGHLITRASENESAIEIPSWVDPNEFLSIRAANIHPCAFRLASSGSGTLRLPRPANLRVKMRSIANCRSASALVVRELHAIEQENLGVRVLLDNAPIVLPSNQEAQILVPLGYRLEVRANDACGGSALSEIDVAQTEMTLTIELAERAQHVIRVVDNDGASVPHASAETPLGDLFKADAAGVIRLPADHPSGSLTVSASGYCPASLLIDRDNPNSNAPSDRLLVLQRSVTAQFTVYAPNERPLPGMRVRVWSPIASDSDFSGSGWSRARSRRASTGITDLTGRFKVGDIPAGEVLVEVDLPPVLGAEQFGRFLYRVVSAHRIVTDDGEYSIVAPAPRNLSFEVLSVDTAQPVDAFELRTFDEMASSISVTGGYWQGWVSEEFDRLMVAVDGLGTETVLLPRTRLTDSVRVFVGEGELSILMLDGLPDGAAALRLEIQVMLHSPEGLHLVRSIVGRVSESGEMLVPIEQGPDTWVGVAPINWGGKSLRFEPDFQPLVAGETLRFRCTE